MPAAASFLFCTCQIGAEPALKQEFARLFPDFKFAYSRPGFVTFKLPEERLLPDDFHPHSVFARSHGFSLGKATAADLDLRAQQAWELAGTEPWDRLHVWQRDLRAAGDHGYEPAQTELSLAAEAVLLRNAPPGIGAGVHGVSDVPEDATQHGQLVLDCVLVEPEEWWLGWHKATSVATRWPGGLCPVTLPEDGVSRAYLKMEEGLRWASLPVMPGDHCAEIGCSPGGASQALLKRGLIVTGIDPALVDERVTSNPNFTHIRKRGADVRRREFRGLKWLFADMNVAPQYTLDTVQDIVTYPQVDVQGMLLTLKFPSWDLAAEIPNYIARVRDWGYQRVFARQLQHNRQEICLAARRK